MLIAVGLFIALFALVRDIPALVVLAAAAPSAVFAAVLFVAGGAGRDSLAAMLSSFLAGAVIAAPTSHVTQWAADASGNPVFTAAVGAPFVEELAKLAVLVASLRLWPVVGLDARRAMMRGAAVGLGFTMLENTQYLLLAAIQGGVERLPLAMFVRGVIGGWHHALYSAITGTGVLIVMTACPRAGRRAIALWAAAVALHIGWNFVVAPLMAAQLCGVPAGLSCLATPRPADLFLIAPALAVAALIPGVLLLWMTPSWLGGPRSSGRAAVDGHRG